MTTTREKSSVKDFSRETIKIEARLLSSDKSCVIS